MFYDINEEKVFSDKVDDQLVFIEMETFVYYTFSKYAAAAISDLISGHSLEAVKAELKKITEDDALESKLDDLIQKLLVENVIFDSLRTEEDDSPMECSQLPKVSVVEISMEQYADVAEYFAADPIHEVNPQMGWPTQKED